MTGPIWLPGAIALILAIGASVLSIRNGVRKLVRHTTMIVPFPAASEIAATPDPIPDRILLIVAPPVRCAWCDAEAGITALPGTSHTICEAHKVVVLATWRASRQGGGSIA